MVVATWTWWVDLKVVARSRSGSLTGWSDLGMGCSHSGQIGSRVGCSWRSDRIRGGLFWIGDHEEWVGGVGWVGEDEGWVGGVPSPCSA